MMKKLIVGVFALLSLGSSLFARMDAEIASLDYLVKYLPVVKKAVMAWNPDEEESLQKAIIFSDNEDGGLFEKMSFLIKQRVSGYQLSVDDYKQELKAFFSKSARDPIYHIVPSNLFREINKDAAFEEQYITYLERMFSRISSQIEIVKKAVMKWDEKSKITFSKNGDGGLFKELCDALEAQVPRKNYRVPFLLRPLITTSQIYFVVVGVGLGVGCGGLANKVFPSKSDIVESSILGAGAAAGGFIPLALNSVVASYDKKLVEKYREALRECFLKLVEQISYNPFTQLLKDRAFVEKYTSYIIHARYK